jgi:hypothetical protein
VLYSEEPAEGGPNSGEKRARAVLGLAGAVMVVCSALALMGYCVTCREVDWFFRNSAIVLPTLGICFGLIVVSSGAFSNSRLRLPEISLAATILALPVGLLLTAAMFATKWCYPCVGFWAAYLIASVIQMRLLSSKERAMLLSGLTLVVLMGGAILVWKPARLEAGRLLASWKLEVPGGGPASGVAVGAQFPLELSGSDDATIFVITECGPCTREALGSALSVAKDTPLLLLPEGLSVPEEASGLRSIRLQPQQLLSIGVPPSGSPHVFELQNGKVTTSLPMVDWTQKEQASQEGGNR